MSDVTARRPGLLAIWSDVAAEEVTDYLHWLTREHTAERVGTPGFLGARVLRAARDDVARFLILYDLAGPGVLASPAYLARLNDPTPWSRRVMPRLRNFARGGGAVVAAAGRGQGAFVAALRLARRPEAEPRGVDGGVDGVVTRLAAGDRVCAARLLAVDAAGTGVATAEKSLRAGDASFAGLLLVEAPDEAALRDALSREGATLAALGAEAPEVHVQVFALPGHLVGSEG